MSECHFIENYLCFFFVFEQKERHTAFRFDCLSVDFCGWITWQHICMERERERSYSMTWQQFAHVFARGSNWSKSTIQTVTGDLNGCRCIGPFSISCSMFFGLNVRAFLNGCIIPCLHLNYRQISAPSTTAPKIVIIGCAVQTSRPTW